MTHRSGRQPKKGKEEIMPGICRPSRDTGAELPEGPSEQAQDGEEENVAAD